MSTRLEMEVAKAALEKAGFTVRPMKIGGRITYLAVGKTPALLPLSVPVRDYMVDNSIVLRIVEGMENE